MRSSKPASIATVRKRLSEAETSALRAVDADTLRTGSTAPPVRDLTLEESLGAQIRLLRRRAELTGADLAGQAGISLGMLSKIENGQISPSLGTLQAVCAALNVPLSQLFSTFEERRDSSFVRQGQGVVIERRGTKAGQQYQLLGHLPGGPIVVEPFLITLQDEAEPYTNFRHEGVELIHMLTGRVVYRHGDSSYEMGPGDTLLFDSAAPHGPERLLEKPMTYLSIIMHQRQEHG